MIVSLNNSCEIFIALSLKAVYNKYAEWLDKYQRELPQGRWMAIIDIKSERDAGMQPNKAEGFATVMQNFMQALHDEEDVIPRSPEEKKQLQEWQQKQMKEFFDTEPTQYLILVTYKVYEN